MILVFLQNAWVGGIPPTPPGQYWHYESWVKALRRSRSGQRLSLIFNDPWNKNEVLFANTTPLIGAKPSVKFPPNNKYILRLLNRWSPKIVLACGQQAEKSLVSLWEGPLLAIPHPAFRLLTNSLLEIAKQYLFSDKKALRFALRQMRGYIKKELI